jgi:hypothetical protein
VWVAGGATLDADKEVSTMSSLPTAGVLVVFESMFGNTEAIARAICDGAAERGVVATAVDVAAAPTDLVDVALLVVGAPTHVLGLPRPRTRASARQQGAPAAEAGGVREWLAGLSRPDGAIPAACFDTRLRSPFSGSAARAIRRRLRRLGFRVENPARFTVTGTAGPLAEGELDRARLWGAELAAGVAAVARTGT